ncbi:MAG: NAD-glutamate dehydrogenase [Pseudoxanthomonas suwonensis]|nr:NAD-glutamate dehydrogenase [Pseudoxanthomonas suwonensis]
MSPIYKAVEARAGKSGAGQAVEFARAFYQRMSDEELPLHSADAWAALAADLLAFARKRKPGTASVRLYNASRKEHGWESPHTVLQVVNDDMPFLVDSVTMALAEMGVGVHVLGHPVVRIGRDKSGKLIAIGEGEFESVMHLEVDRQTSDGMAAIQARVSRVLEDVRATVRDWPQMREKMREIAGSLDERGLRVSAAVRDEAAEFLRWAADEHFTFLGYRSYTVQGKGDARKLVADADSSLGLLRDQQPGKPRLLKSIAAHHMPQSGAVDALILTKTNARATVHRPGFMDYIGILRYDKDGNAIGEDRFIGLYTSGAYKRRPWDIPLVRKRFDHVMERAGFEDSGHSAKALKHILETLPRDELFQSSEAELHGLATGILGLQERVRSRLFLRRDRYGRFFSALVYIPRERYNTDVRLRVEDLLRRNLGAEQIDVTVQMGESPLAQLHVIARPKPDVELPSVDLPKLEAALTALVRDWQDALREHLIADHGEEQGLALSQRYGDLLPGGYIEQATPMVAARDVAMLDELAQDGKLRVSLRTDASASVCDECFEVKIFTEDESLPLSDVLPVLENLGLRVVAEYPHRVAVDEKVLYIQDIEVLAADRKADPATHGDAFIEAFQRTWSGQGENDGFNRLVLGAGLDWRQVSVLRCYGKYLQQVGVPFSQSYVEQTFARYPLLARLVVALFEARFDPALDGRSARKVRTTMAANIAQSLQRMADDPQKGALQRLEGAGSDDRHGLYDAVRATLMELLEGVSSLDEDRIFRGFVDTIEATLRTSHYIPYAEGQRKDGGPADYISFKIDAAKVPDSPKPHPYREIWVCGPRVEGTHLRFGPVARGGLRWSDRREDFRTEVLGLVKAQMVKNTIIIPVGSKGGFYAKQLPDPAVDRDAWFAEGVACYKRFINGMLDITDNLVDGKVVPPEGVVRHDGDDPYLVVAADKGTATFSDIANGIAQAHGFWMDDAFASGGSVGYDHKGMGITARGAWESVKNHFRALGHDTQKQDFTVAGIGDMSGDVFGNGMQLSRHIRLVAAFDHRHVFLDPNPDAATSFKERQRLFKLARSSWADYDATLISKGGGVHSRSAKSIKLTPEVKEVLGLDPALDALSPSELVSAVLKAPVDLLWNGGIGTYVKSSRQSHADVGDRGNNAVRIDGRDLRCKVVGEGGNLGFTQLGRIEAAQHGVLINTDFIDNSAGVGTSDHEVNIKILLGSEVRKGKLKLPERNKLLASMTNEVAGLVLRDNYRQNQTLSLMQRMMAERLGSKVHFLQTLEAQGLLDRQIEDLPSDAELAERRARGQGFARPELAVLLAYSKLVTYPQLMASDVPEDPYLSGELQRYFPEPLQAKYGKAMEQHQLKREIIATAVTNSTINRMGATFLMRMEEDSGRSVGEIAKAYTITRETLEARNLWDQIDALDGKVAQSAQIDALMTIWELQRSFTRWLLARPGAIPGIADAVKRYHDGFSDIRSGERILPDSQRPAYEAALADWKAKGLPKALSEQLAALPYLEACPDIIELASERKLRPVEVAKVYFRLGDALHAPWLREQIEALKVDGRWHAVARGVLREELSEQLRKLTSQVLAMPGKDPQDKVDAWMVRDDATLRFTLGMLTELVAQKTLDYPTVSVAVQRLAQLANRG